MRKPAVVVTLFLALILSITLARRLAQPAIADERQTVSSAESSKVFAVAEATVVPAVALAMPVRPSASAVSVGEDSSATPQNDGRARKSRASNASSRAQRGILSSSKPSPDSPSIPSYQAMLGSPVAAFRAVKDHGAHGIGTPQWIDSLSGAKGRVPVRDFDEEASHTGQSFAEPLAVSVDSGDDLGVDSAH